MIRRLIPFLALLCLLSACASPITVTVDTPTPAQSPTHKPEATVKPSPTTAPTPTPKVLHPPSKAQVDDLVSTLYIMNLETESYNTKTGVLVVKTIWGYKIGTTQKEIKDALETIQDHFWKAHLDFTSVTANIYIAPNGTDYKKMAYATLIYQTAQTIDWDALLGHAPLWDKYDKKYIDPKIEA